jgi:hypothetical protein
MPTTTKFKPSPGSLGFSPGGLQIQCKFAKFILILSAILGGASHFSVEAIEGVQKQCNWTFFVSHFQSEIFIGSG